MMSALPRDQYAATNGRAEFSGAGRPADAAPTRPSDHDFHRAPPQLVEVMCECGHSNCSGNIAISLREYEAVRLHPTRFLIKEGHEVADVVRVVGSGTGYVVVARLDADAFSVRGLQ
jgi:hypothetical protein